MKTAETAVDIPPGNVEFGDFALLVNVRHELKITQQVGWFVSDADGFIVTLEVFSGVPDPQWMILRNNVDGPMFQEIKKGLDSARKYDPENAPGKLGYEGFLVQEVKDGEKQPEVLIVGQSTVNLQLLLLKSMPKGLISEKIYKIVHKEIQDGNVGAVFGSTKKRQAVSYLSSYWNHKNHIELNNCYNYASTIRTDTFAQPGRASGRWLPHLFKAEHVKLSAMADGLTVEPDLPCMKPPGGHTHLVALVYYEGENV